jgi:hypothetical protein
MLDKNNPMHQSYREVERSNQLQKTLMNDSKLSHEQSNNDAFFGHAFGKLSGSLRGGVE